MVFSYQIYDNFGQRPTGYWLCAGFYSPADLFSHNDWSCVIYKGDPRDEAPPALLSPYTCVWEDTRGDSPRPKLTVDTATVVTNNAQAKHLLAQHCNDANAASNCAYIDYGYGTALGPFKIVGQTVFNRGETEVEHELGGETEESSSNTIGVELSTSVELWEVWKSSIKLNYEHEWETSHKFTETTTAKIDPQSVGWVEFAANMQSTQGIWVINTGDQRYVIPSVTLTAPLADGGQLVVYECAIAHFNDGVCTKELTTTVVDQ